MRPCTFSKKKCVCDTQFLSVHSDFITAAAGGNRKFFLLRLAASATTKERREDFFDWKRGEFCRARCVRLFGSEKKPHFTFRSASLGLWEEEKEGEYVYVKKGVNKKKHNQPPFLLEWAAPPRYALSLRKGGDGRERDTHSAHGTG